MENINLIYLGAVLGSILLSMTLHEAMHAFAGYWLGDDTAKLEGRLTLNPFAHIDPFTTVLLPLLLAAVGAPPFGAAKPVPFNPYRLRFGEYGAAIVGLAGPLTNLVLALLSGLLLRVLNLDDVGVTILLTFVIVNVSFFVFNMIPFPPLDGSRLLYAFAPDWIREAMGRIEAMGFAAIIFFMLFFYAFLSTPFVAVIQALVRAITGYSF